MRFKLLALLLSGVLLTGPFIPAVAASVPAKAQNSVSEDNVIKYNKRVVVAYNKKYSPTRSSIPQVYQYNDGKYAGQLKITVVTSYRDGAGDWWGVTYEGPVHAVYSIFPV
ncbi:PAS sensor protein [Paenibacillus profundus]|uniref:PAS sensor protein n=1 Tax=Paenibacillus profundus TaxID=1173085 RepID=A0ABS8YTT1_9BACL|nr:PAS sensor protein [Paenibacillus profundus]MCE5173049.1 PAS sensor protein [Paenibacillus profundus]